MSVDKDVLAHATNTNYRTLVDDGSIGNILDKSTLLIHSQILPNSGLRQNEVPIHTLVAWTFRCIVFILLKNMR